MWEARERNPQKFLSGEYGQLKFVKELAVLVEGHAKQVLDDGRRAVDHTDRENPSHTIAIVVEAVRVIWRTYSGHIWKGSLRDCELSLPLPGWSG